MEVTMVCARLSKTFVAGALAGTVGLASTASLEARPLPVATAATIAGDAPVAEAGWRGYGYGHHGYGYRHYGYRRSHGGAIFAGAALGILGLAAASAANSGYYGGGYPYYGYGYRPAYYSYGYPAYYSYPRVRYYHYPRRVHYYPRRVHYYRPAYYGYRW
jgi:hypothetical protein